METALHSIFSSYKRDFLFLILPAHLCLLVLSVAFNLSFLAIIILIVIDNGHVYTTFFRLIKTKLTRIHKRQTLIFIFSFICIAMMIQLLSNALIWKFALYATFFHYMKQNIGFFCFYQKLENTFNRFNIKALYAFQLLGAAALHFRGDSKLEYYSSNDLFSYPNDFCFNFVIIIYLLLTIISITKNWNNLLTPSYLFNLHIILLFSYPLFTSLPITNILLALIVSHGLSYLFLISKSLHTPQKNFAPLSYFVACLVIAIIFGFGENSYESVYVSYLESEVSLMSRFFISLFLLPLFTHFFLDSILWKKGNYEINSIIKDRTFL